MTLRINEKIEPIDRAEGSAHVLNRDLMRYCRVQALNSADPTKPAKTAEEFQEQIAAAVNEWLWM